MKFLMVGIDGLGAESLAALQLRRLQEIIEQGRSANPLPDNMVSRGWTEIYSGKNAYETGGFFQIPVMSKNRIVATQDTGVSTIAGHIGAENLLWGKLRRAGHRVGVFTLPTVNKRQDDCELSIPATGGGVFSAGIDSAAAKPAQAASLANYGRSNLGFRMGKGAFLPASRSELEAWLRDHIAQYFTTLRRTLDRYPVDSLVLGSRFVTLHYKFRHILCGNPGGPDDAALRDLILEIARDFDGEMAAFITDANPEHLFITSDHGLGELKFHVNINALLRELGLIDYPGAAFRLARFGKRKVLERRQPRRQRGPLFPMYGLERSRAFSIGYTDVVYVNDARFTGPSMSNEERYTVACVVAEELSQHVRERGYEQQFREFIPMKHQGWSSPGDNGAPAVALPDIRCVLEEGTVNLGRTGGEVVRVNETLGARDMFRNGFFAEHSACKTSDCLAAYRGSAEMDFGPQRLTDVYGAMLKPMGID